MQENAIGVLIAYQVLDNEGQPKDISSATEKKFKFARPNGDVFVTDCDFLSDGADGILTYVTEAGDLSPAGHFRIQAWIKLTPPYETWTELAKFYVSPNLRALPDPS